MEAFIAAILLGLGGSLHCLGMCGPLVVAVHQVRSGEGQWLSRIIYHSGRIAVYVILGALAGSIGKAFVAVGFQQWVAVVSGLLMILFLAWPVGMKFFKKGPLNLVGKIKSRFSGLIRKKGMWSHLILGVINGLLPCGLVYMAVAASMTQASAVKSAAFMAVFGMGTFPALLAAGSLLGWLGQKLRVRSYRAIQFTLVAVSMLVIIRGANLGIPYLSPKFTQETQKVDCCHSGDSSCHK